MSEIDVSKCIAYDEGKCYDDLMEHLYCKDNKNCTYKQLQQLKAENEKLCTTIRNELSEQYNKRVSEAESDIEWGVLDRNATESEFCKNVIYETRNYIAKLEQENEELHRRQNVFNIFKKIDKYKNTLDEIEELEKAYCKECLEKGNKSELYCVKCINRYILDTIKQTKEGGE